LLALGTGYGAWMRRAFFFVRVVRDAKDGFTTTTFDFGFFVSFFAGAGFG
jgi:hypothetical protein